MGGSTACSKAATDSQRRLTMVGMCVRVRVRARASVCLAVFLCPEGHRRSVLPSTVLTAGGKLALFFI